MYTPRNCWLSKKLLISVLIVMAKHIEVIFKEGRRKKEGASPESISISYWKQITVGASQPDSDDGESLAQ